MKKIEKQIIITEYQTTDGKIFKEEFLPSAEIHQDVLDGIKKYCPDCDGDGRHQVDEGTYGYFEKWVWKQCKTCKGRGYLELKWA